MLFQEVQLCGLKAKEGHERFCLIILSKRSLPNYFNYSIYFYEFKTELESFLSGLFGYPSIKFQPINI